MRGTLVVSDPWEFASLTGLQSVSGAVEIFPGEAVTVRLDLPLVINGQAMTRADVTPRHAGHPFATPCTDTPASIAFRSADQSAWYAAIGTLTLE